MAPSLFPLPLASIETLHLLDDPPAFPNNIFARLTFDSPLDESLARESFQAALLRHLRGTAVVEKHRGRWRWVDRKQWPEFVWQPGSLAHQFRPLDLQRSPGVRVVMHESSAGWQVHWQVHHALVDGLGGLQFVRDWMVAYDNLRWGRPADTGWIQLDPSALRRRNELGLLTRRYLAHGWKQPIALFGAAKFLLRRFQTIESPNGLAEQALAADYPAVLTIRYEREEVSALRRAAHRTGVTLNSILLAGTFAATDAWLRGQPSYSPREYLRMIVPISIRMPADVTMPACNRASLVQLDRLSREMADREGLARGIDFELGLIRRWQLDKMFLLAVRVNAMSTRWLQHRTARQKRRATTMLTNLGRPFLKTGLPVEHRQLTMGGHVLTDVELVAPIRAGMPLSLAVVEYAGRLHLTLHYDSRVVSSEPARQFLAGVDERLRQFI